MLFWTLSIINYYYCYYYYSRSHPEGDSNLSRAQQRSGQQTNKQTQWDCVKFITFNTPNWLLPYCPMAILGQRTRLGEEEGRGAPPPSLPARSSQTIAALARQRRRLHLHAAYNLILFALFLIENMKNIFWCAKMFTWLYIFSAKSSATCQRFAVFWKDHIGLLDFLLNSFLVSVLMLIYQ